MYQWVVRTKMLLLGDRNRLPWGKPCLMGRDEDRESSAYTSEPPHKPGWPSQHAGPREHTHLVSWSTNDLVYSRCTGMAVPHPCTCSVFRRGDQDRQSPGLW